MPHDPRRPAIGATPVSPSKSAFGTSEKRFDYGRMAIRHDHAIARGSSPSRGGVFDRLMTSTPSPGSARADVTDGMSRSHARPRSAAPTIDGSPVLSDALAREDSEPKAMREGGATSPAKPTARADDVAPRSRAADVVWSSVEVTVQHAKLPLRPAAEESTGRGSLYEAQSAGTRGGGRARPSQQSARSPARKNWLRPGATLPIHIPIMRKQQMLIACLFARALPASTIGTFGLTLGRRSAAQCCYSRTIHCRVGWRILHCFR